ncbi:TRAP transporter large permease subunit [Allopusillimonas ginsengisoli]|uniref:TRAP transporter large permease subunit n=1 Tax=Allopusillimonas ginsengisoli TaxID=453575 RepID=UPI0010C1C0A7|nr:TRAP transporter large permease subunit [Allopusillimonas ginsengisoli]
MTLFVFLGSLLGSLAIGVPVALALVLCGAAMMIQLDNFDVQIVASNMINGVDNFIFLAVPFFMLAGELMNAGGLSRRIVAMALALIGHLRGGLGYVAIIAAVLMASLSGSAIADSAALGALLIPMMRSAGYEVGRSAGLVAAGGIIAPIIPPSIGLIMYGIIGNVSITKLFIAGIFPGIMMGIALTLTWWGLNRNSAMVRPPRASRTEMVKAVGNGAWALMLPVIIVGGLRTGIFTPTESAVVAVFYALSVGAFVYRELTWKLLYECLVSAARTTAIVMFIVAAAFVSAWMITIANLPGQLSALLVMFLDSPVVLMGIMMLLTIIVGAALDFTPLVLILTPIMLPVAKQAGIDPVYFGVVFVMCIAIGLLTPPVGNVLNVVAGVSKVRFEHVVRGVFPFLLAEVGVVILLVLFPQLLLTPLSWFY